MPAIVTGSRYRGPADLTLSPMYSFIIRFCRLAGGRRRLAVPGRRLAAVVQRHVGAAGCRVRAAMNAIAAITRI